MIDIKSIHFPSPVADEMVRAILEDRKMVTRRVVKLKYGNTHLEMRTDKYGTRLIELQNEEPGVTTVRNPDGTTTHKLLAAIKRTPPYRPGDILYVRETFCRQPSKEYPFVYKASVETPAAWKGQWHPSIHMPREAARIFLRVKEVRVERLQDITEEQAQLEGAKKEYQHYYDNVITAREVFQGIWYSTIKPADRDLYGWDANPWVFVISFERIPGDEALQ